MGALYWTLRAARAGSRQKGGSAQTLAYVFGLTDTLKEDDEWAKAKVSRDARRAAALRKHGGTGNTRIRGGTSQDDRRIGSASTRDLPPSLMDQLARSGMTRVTQSVSPEAYTQVYTWLSADGNERAKAAMHAHSAGEIDDVAFIRILHQEQRDVPWFTDAVRAREEAQGKSELEQLLEQFDDGSEYFWGNASQQDKQLIVNMHAEGGTTWRDFTDSMCRTAAPAVAAAIGAPDTTQGLAWVSREIVASLERLIAAQTDVAPSKAKAGATFGNDPLRPPSNYVPVPAEKAQEIFDALVLGDEGSLPDEWRTELMAPPGDTPAGKAVRLELAKAKRAVLWAKDAGVPDDEYAQILREQLEYQVAGYIDRLWTQPQRPDRNTQIVIGLAYEILAL